MLFSRNAEHVDQIFEKIDLPSKEIDSNEFVGCIFLNCDFSEKVFRSCNFEECQFQKCNLSLMKVIDSSFSNTTIKDSKAIGINWTEMLWPNIRLSCPLKFLNCDISLCTFIGLDLREIIIKECRAHDVDFRETDLRKADMTYTDFANSQFIETDLTRANFTHAINYSIDIYLNKIAKAKFALPEALSLLNSLDIELEQFG